MASDRPASAMLLPAAKRPASRDRYFDNVKAMLLFAVIAVHSSLVWDARGKTCKVVLVDWVFPVFLHVVMPCFSFVSGHLTNARLTRVRIERLLVSTLVVVLFNTLYSLSMHFGGKAALALANSTRVQIATSSMREYHGAANTALVPLQVFAQHQATWFLVALILWRASLPAVLLLRWPLAVVTLIALIAPFTDYGSAGLSQAVGYWPFFVAGHLLPRTRLESLRASLWLRLAFIAVAILMAVLSLIPATRYGLTHVELPGLMCLYGEGFQRAVYDCRASPSLIGTLVAYPACTFMVLGFLTLVPRRRIFGLSLAGRLSMYAYLLHTLVVLNPLVWLALEALLDTIGCERALPVYCLYVCIVWALLSSPLARLLCYSCVELPIAKRCCWPDDPERPTSQTVEQEQLPVSVTPPPPPTVPLPTAPP